MITAMRLRSAGSLVLTLTAVMLLACGDDGSDPEEAAPAENPAEQAAEPKKPTPTGCLEEAGLTDVQRRDQGLWRGMTVDGTGVLVERMPSRADARQAQRQADLVVSEAVGRWFVHGPLRDADDGSTAAVADCLRGG